MVTHLDSLSQNRALTEVELDLETRWSMAYGDWLTRPKVASRFEQNFQGTATSSNRHVSEHFSSIKDVSVWFSLY